MPSTGPIASGLLANRKRKGRGNAKCGNRYLCWAYIEAANFAIRFNPTIAGWYHRMRAKRHRIVALKAVAHKLARAAYHMMRDHTSFDTLRAFARQPSAAADRNGVWCPASNSV